MLHSFKDFETNPPSTFKLDKTVLLGRGAYGIVYRGTLDVHEVAVKRLQRVDLEEMDGPSFSQQPADDREIDALRIFDHPNVLKLHFVYNDDDFKYLVLERCAATLNQYCQGQYECQLDDKKKALFQMTEGLHYIHSQKFVHRDIKTDNVLIWHAPANNTEVVLKISDFGFCKPANERGSFSLGSGIKGTKTFTAPELLKVEAGPKRRGSVKCDIFSLGCVFYTFLTTGGHPFLLKGGSDYNIPVNIEQGNYNLDALDRYNQSFAKGMIKGMIKADPLKRIQLEDVKTILLSP